MKVNEIFESIQGEGAYAGQPMLFIRLSGCNKDCDWCDSKYHIEHKIMSNETILKIIEDSKFNKVCFTGGEPLIQLFDIIDIIINSKKEFHLETNGSLIDEDIILEDMSIFFNYISISPKNEDDAKLAKEFFIINKNKGDIKVVTDLTLNKDLLQYATMLMPLTTNNDELNLQIEKDVWKYCVDNNIKYCLRQHYKVWGHKRGV